MKRRTVFRASFALVALAAIGVATVPLASKLTGTQVRNQAPAPANVAGSTPGTAAMRAYLNPETGKLEVGAAPAPAAAFDPHTQNALRRDATGLVQKSHPDGSVSINLQGRFQSVSVLKMVDGRKVVVCTGDSDEAARALHGQTTPEVK